MKMVDKSTFIKHVAAMAIVALSATGCLGEAPLETELFVPSLSVVHEAREAAELFNYLDDEETGFTVGIAAVDVDAHGLPEEFYFIANGSANARANAVMSAYAPGGLPIPDQFDCFGPIEIRDLAGDVTVTIDNFCPDDNTPVLTIIGDISADGDPRWAFDSPDGRVLTNFDE